MEPVQVLNVSKSADGMQALYHATDPKASYTLLSPDAEDYNPASVEWVSGANVDYNLVAPASFERKPGGHGGLPMSYLAITTVAAGTEWYKANTKYPDEVCEMMAKYEWGNLKRTTKKEFRNQKKKAVKKGAQGPPFQVKRGPVFVTFD
jgi:hypothetical protein|tara:strand:- start:141 stop:587 length:447 start_codon:yes stop_codon:yes gene_type:complete